MTRLSAIPATPLLLLALASCAPRAASPLLAPGVPLLTREQWGALPPVSAMRPHRIRAITIHHTATPQKPEVPLAEKLRALQRFSQQESPLASGGTKPPWPDVPYHYYVDHAGRVAEGRGAGYAGDTNTAYDPAGHLLLVLEGNFEVEEPTEAQLRTLRRLVRELSARYGVEAARIASHRDYADTLCPGERLYRHLPALRALAEEGR